MAQRSPLLVHTGTLTDFVLLFFLKTLGFCLHLHCFHYGLSSGSSTGSSGGGGVPIDLVCMHGTGDPHGDSSSYTKSLSDSCLDVDGFGVPTGLQGLALLSLVS